MLHNRHADSQTTDRQSHQTLEGIDAQRENRRIEWAVAQRLHDRAFDQGLISIDDDYRIMVNHDKVRHSDINDRWLYDFDGHEISLPAISQPSHEFIEYHHKHIFLANAA